VVAAVVTNEVELWAAPIPLPSPVVTPAGIFDTYHHLVVIASDGEDLQGWGIAGSVTNEALDLTVDRARVLLAAAEHESAGLLAVEGLEAAESAIPCDRFSRWAACALATAGWDLAARRAGVRCADLWAIRAAPTELDCYASGFFLSTPEDELVLEAQRFRAAGFAKVKMRTGGEIDSDLSRLALVRSIFPEPGAIAVDAVNGWDPLAARSFIDGAGSLLWVEDPVPLDAVGELRDVDALVAAGESLTSLPELDALFATGAVPAVLLDVQQLGGPERFLEAARRLRAAGALVGAHILTHVSAHLLAAIDDPLPVEIFDWSDPLCVEPLQPLPSGRVEVAGPGLGVEIDRSTLLEYGTRVV
jgi:L-alanine-DL-glutamate epimerase-like enolase superfamily enzyme